MKSLLVATILLELGFSLWFASSFCWLHPDFLQAMRAVREHPSSAAALAELDTQRQVASLAQIVVGAVVFGSLLLIHVTAAILRCLVARLARRFTGPRQLDR